MNFDFSEEQYALRDTAREFFAERSPPAHVRAMWDNPTGRSLELWQQMAQLGLLGLTVPEEYGGLGLDEIDLVLVLSEAGYAALCEPLLETGIGVALLTEAGTTAQQQQWLPLIAAGEAIVTVWLPGERYVADAHVADLLLDVHDGILRVLTSDDFKATVRPSLDGARRICAVTTTRPESASGTQTDIGLAGQRAYDRAAAGTAAVLVGVGQRLLDLTVAYVSAREQFDRPVGSFQAVKHQLADALLGIDTARGAVWYAALALAGGQNDASRAASIAKSCAADAQRAANYAALQLHGGIGFTQEHDLHLWLQRGTALEAAYGSATLHRSRLAAYLFDQD